MTSVIRTLSYTCLYLSLLTLAGSVFAAGDIAAGEEKARACVRCHGPEGVTDNPMLPNLAGQNPGYLIKQLQSYRKRDRRSTPMQDITLGLTDQDIEDLAAYYYSLGTRPARE